MCISTTGTLKKVPYNSTEVFHYCEAASSIGTQFKTAHVTEVYNQTHKSLQTQLSHLFTLSKQGTSLLFVLK